MRIRRDLIDAYVDLDEIGRADELAVEIEKSPVATVRDRNEARLRRADFAWMSATTGTQAAAAIDGWARVLAESGDPDLRRVAAFRLVAADSAPQTLGRLLDPDRARRYPLWWDTVVDPASAPAWYLVGRDQYFDDRWDAARISLSRALDLGLLSAELEYETHRLVGLSAYQTDRLADAERAFRAMAPLTSTTGQRMYIEEMLRRCRWAAAYRGESTD